MKQYIRSLLRRLPAYWKGTLEFYYDKVTGRDLGHPFNGQPFRHQVFGEILKAVSLEAIIETGTYLGTTAIAMAEESQLPVYTVEAMPRFFHYAGHRLSAHTRIHASFGDSRQFLNGLVGELSVPKQNVLFYLDAHWDKELPLYEEVEIIALHWKGSVVMIDDFEVPGDEGYAYDDYGEGNRLCLAYLMPLILQFGWKVFFPTATSMEEGGAKRGWVVLADPRIETAIKGISLLRPHN